MKDRFQQLIALFMSARPATRITLVIGTLMVSAIAVASSWYANRPDFVQLWSGMSSAEAAEYKNALAQANIPFRSSPPPENGIWVDANNRDQAEAHVAMAGYRPVAKGIQVSDGGAASAFLSARSRNQMANKREWQECELQLEHLNFVERATVVSSGADTSPFGPAKEPTISVTLGLRNGLMLDSSQARTVATLVRSRFNVPLTNITVVDEQGNLLHDGMDSGTGMSGSELFAHKRRYDSDAERRAQRALEMALGRGMAYVTVNSSWVFDEMESITESTLPSSALYYESKSETKNSAPKSAAGGPAGMSSNITQDYGNESAGIGGGSGGGGRDQSTINTEKRSVVGRETAHRTSRTPKITRLTLALYLDESKADKVAEIEGAIKATVGFDEKRGDTFEFLAMPLASIERDEEGMPIAPVPLEPVEAPNEYVQMMIEHGVEIVAALGFLLVLMKSLKGASGMKSTKAEGTATATVNGPAPGSDEYRRPELTQEEIDVMDMELLARAQVEDLVRSDPEKVSEILAQWVKATTGPVSS